MPSAFAFGFGETGSAVGFGETGSAFAFGDAVAICYKTIAL